MKIHPLRRLVTLALSLGLMLSIFPVPVMAADYGDAVVYDAADYAPFKGRTREEVAQRYSDALYAGASYSDSDSSTWYEVPASTQNPYNAGKLTQDTHTSMTAMLNFYRWLVGAKEVTKDSTHSDSLQAQALDRNFEFAHVISNESKPADMPQEIWDAGFQLDHNVLASGYSPQGAITGWLNEGYSLSQGTWDTLGHRMLLLDFRWSDIQFGYSGRVAVGKDIADDNTPNDLPFAAFPAPGYMPQKLVESTASAWSVELNPAYVTMPSQDAITVTVTQVSTGNSYQCTTANGKLYFPDSTYYPNHIAFVQPTPDVYYYSGDYTVEITGLTDAKTGKAAVLRYTVQFVDISDLARSEVTNVSCYIPRFELYEDAADQLDMLLPLLPTEVKVTARSGLQVEVPVSGEWKIDEQNQCFVNSVDAAKLPSNLTDPNGLLNRVTIPYTLSTSTYQSYSTLTISPSTAMPGDEVTFTVRGAYNFSQNSSSAIFKVTQNQDGTYSAEQVFDSHTAENAEITSTNHTYRKNVTEADKGSYIALYYNTYSYGGSSSVYVCNGTKDLMVSPCQHKAGEPVKENEKAATCTEEGSYDEVTYCSLCGEELSHRTVAVPATGHKPGEPVKENEKDATCTEDGSYDEVTYCTVCKAETDRKTVKVPATGHKSGEPVKENEKDATCTEDGSYDEVTYCTVCGKELSRKVVKVPAAHTPGEPVKENEKAATCTEEGSYDEVIYCSVCSDELSRKTVTTQALGHEYQSQVTQPTCTEKGYTTYTCSRCGDEYRADFTPAPGHNYVGTVTKEPTADDEGEKTYTCSRCGDSYTESIPALGHHWDEGKITKEPTCTEPGIKTYTCTDAGCGRTYEETIPANGHKPGEAVKENEKAPTCTEDGSYDEVIRCTVCNAELSRNTVPMPATGHKPGEAVRENEKAATCTEDGSYDEVIYCSVCNAELSRNPMTVPATGHKPGEPVKENEKAATCTEDGSYDEVVYCTVCDEELSRETVKIPAAHTPGETVKENEKAPTCTEEGSYDEVIYCTVCDEELVRNTVKVPATGHNYVDGVCTVCGEKEPVSHVHTYGEPTFVWSEDHRSATAVFACVAGDHEEQVPCVVTCETDDQGNTVYTAYATFGDSTYTEEKTLTAEDGTGGELTGDPIPPKDQPTTSEESNDSGSSATSAPQTTSTPAPTASPASTDSSAAAADASSNAQTTVTSAIPQTGDEQEPMLWVVVMAVSLAGFVTLITKKGTRFHK